MLVIYFSHHGCHWKGNRRQWILVVHVDVPSRDDVGVGCSSCLLASNKREVPSSLLQALAILLTVYLPLPMSRLSIRLATFIDSSLPGPKVSPSSSGAAATKVKYEVLAEVLDTKRILSHTLLYRV